jgi:hypothetical protein
MITQAELKHRLNYNPLTGVFVWRNPSKYRQNYTGNVAGSLHSHGYVVISIDSKPYPAHRLAWLYMYGEFPTCCTDHINGIRNDNRIENLRAVDKKGNAENRRSARVGHTSGMLGVVWRPSRGKYEARISVNKRYMYLGLFPTADAAHEAYLAAKRKYHAACTI